MRSVLVDHARGGRAARPLTLGAAGAVADRESEPGADVLALDEALRRLAALDARQAQVVDLRYFGRLSIAEPAQALGVSHATVERDWRTARARLWLRRELNERTQGEER